MRNKFEREMSELEAEMLKMSKFVVNVINDAMKALRTGDRELARSIFENDHVAAERAAGRRRPANNIDGA